MAKFGGFVSPLKGIDAKRDKEREGARSFSVDAASYAENHDLGNLMSEMLNALVVSKPEKPVDFLIELLGKSAAPKLCLVGPPGFAMESLTDAICGKYNVVFVSAPPLIEEARERIIDGKTVAEHTADGKAIPDQIAVKLITERLVKPDCVEKGWLLHATFLTKGLAQQLVAADHVPDKVVYVSAPDDTLLKAVSGGEDERERKKQLADQLRSYRWELAKAVPVFSHVSRQFEAIVAYTPPDQIEAIQSFLAEKSSDPGLKDIKRK